MSQQLFGMLAQLKQAKENDANQPCGFDDQQFPRLENPVEVLRVPHTSATSLEP
jgi:hypothetical protein